MLFIRFRQLVPLLISLLISCFVLGGYSESIAAFRFAGGAYELGYSAQEESENGTLVGDADSLWQRLSLSTVNKGRLYNMRNSPYSLSLGYSNQRYSTNIQGTNYTPSGDDIRWQGEISLIQSRRRGMSIYAMTNKSKNSIFSSNIPGSGISATFPVELARQDTSSEHGISVIKGSKQTLKSFLSHYRSSKGYKGLEEDKQFSHLSLQRGINWIHFDFDQNQSYGNKIETRTIRMGNIRHIAGVRFIPKGPRGGTRDWFRLTNWFEISSDLTYTTQDENEANMFNYYRVNFFGRGYRKTWDMFVAPAYSARKDNVYANRSLGIPLSVSYNPNKYFHLFSTTNYGKTETLNDLGITLGEGQTMSQNFSASIAPRDGLSIRPDYVIIRNDSRNAKSLIQNASIFINAYNDNIATSLTTSYNVQTTDINDGTGSKGDSFSVQANALYRRLAWFRNLSLTHNYSTASSSSEDKKESNTTRFGTSVVPSYRLQADFDASYQVTQEGSAAKSESKEVEAEIKYDTKKKFSNMTFINMNITENNDSSNKRSDIRNESTYKISKNLESKTDIKSKKNSSIGSDSKSYAFAQRIYYARRYGGFFGRRIYDISAIYGFDKSESSRFHRKTNQYSVVINYYVTRAITLGGAYSYASNNSSDVNTETNLYAKVHYPKLQVGLSYSSNINKNSGAGDKIVERISFSLTKYF